MPGSARDTLASLTFPATARSRQSTACTFFAGLTCIFSGIFHTYLLAKFTPVYSETECGDETAMLDRFEFSGTVALGMNVNVICRNPNPYSIQILASSPGRVFIQFEGVEPKRVEVGRMRLLTGSSLNEQGTGTVAVRLDAQLSDMQADAILPHLLQDEFVRVLLELQFDVGVSVSFGLGRWGTSAPFHKKCGLSMAGLLVNRFVDATGPEQESRLGPLVCGGDFEGMRIPAVGDVERIPADGRMGFTAAQVAPAEVAAGELTKNLSLLTAMLLSFSCGLALVYASWIKAGHVQSASLGGDASRLCKALPTGENIWRSPFRAFPPHGCASEEVAMLYRWDEDSLSEGEPLTSH